MPFMDNNPGLCVPIWLFIAHPIRVSRKLLVKIETNYRDKPPLDTGSGVELN